MGRQKTSADLEIMMMMNRLLLLSLLACAMAAPSRHLNFLGYDDAGDDYSSYSGDDDSGCSTTSLLECTASVLECAAECAVSVASCISCLGGDVWTECCPCLDEIIHTSLPCSR